MQDTTITAVARGRAIYERAADMVLEAWRENAGLRRAYWLMSPESFRDLRVYAMQHGPYAVPDFRHGFGAGPDRLFDLPIHISTAADNVRLYGVLAGARAA